jgi:dihydropyrimidinase
VYDLIIKNGKVVSPSSTIEHDIAIKDGIIEALGTFDEKGAKRVVDAKGKFVLPGGVEAHMHCQAPFQGALGANTFYEQSISAAFGGVTTFMDFTNMSRGDSPYTQVLARKKEMEESAIDYSVHGKIVESTKEAIDDIPRMAEIGVPTFKMFMTYKKEGVMADDETLLKVFEKAKEVNGLPLLHCESNAIAETNIEKYVQDRDLSWKNFAKSKPVLCEAEAFSRAAYFAKYTNTAILVVHTTNKDALDIARRAQAEGFPLYVETGPHYLTLFDDLYEKEDGYLAICSPPLRTKKEAAELWDGIMDGTISVIGSDDCTFDVDEKSMFLEKNEEGTWKQDFTKVVNGLSGLEIRLPIMLSEGVSKGRISINNVCAFTSTNVAKLSGCFPRKGIIAPGSDADIVIVDMEKEVTLSTETLHNNISYCLHDGMKIKGYPVMTIANGKVIVENGKFLGEKGAGKFIERSIDTKYLEKYEII